MSRAFFADYFGLRIKWSDTENLHSLTTLDLQLPPRCTCHEAVAHLVRGARFCFILVLVLVLVRVLLFEVFKMALG